MSAESIPLEEPAAEMPEVVTTEIKQDCRVNLDTEQFLEAGRDLASSQAELHQLENDFKSVRDEWKSRISAVEARITMVAGRISRGYDIKQVKCIVTMDAPTPGMKTCTRTDTGERVWVREMSMDDKQLVLDLDAKNEEEAAEEAADSEGDSKPADAEPAKDGKDGEY